MQYFRSISCWQRFPPRIALRNSLGILAASQVAIALMSSPALAASRLVTIDDLVISNGRLTVEVPSGYGVVLDLSSVGQIVTGASFGDATKFVIAGIDGQLCYMQQDKCEATGASVVAFRPVKGIEIPTQSHAPDGSTSVTLTTDGKLGRKVLHMRLVPAVKATYTAIVVKESMPLMLATASTPARQTRPTSRYTNPNLVSQPSSRVKPLTFATMAVKPIALPPSLATMEFQSCVPFDGKTIEVTNPTVVAQTRKPQTKKIQVPNPTVIAQVHKPQARKIEATKPSVVAQAQQPQSKKPPTTKPAKSPVTRPGLIGSTMNKSDANALAMGLSMANPKRSSSVKIAPRSAKYNQVQTAIVKLRGGKTREQAAIASGLELQFINQLIDLGQ